MQSERAVESSPSSIIEVELVQSPFGAGYTLLRYSDCQVPIYPPDTIISNSIPAASV